MGAICLPRLGAKDVVIGTTGFTSREIYELRTQMGDRHDRDFLTVGSMGHASAIAQGVAMHTSADRQVICFDGDGAMLMHMGNMATIGAARLKNLKHVLINNAAHDSVGGQPVKLGDSVAIADALGYNWTRRAETAEELRAAFHGMLKAEGPAFLEVRTRPGCRPDLGRPKSSPVANKKALMGFLASRS